MQMINNLIYRARGYLIFKYHLALFFYLTSLISQSRPNSISSTGIGIPVLASQPIISMRNFIEHFPNFINSN